MGLQTTLDIDTNFVSLSKSGPVSSSAREKVLASAQSFPRGFEVLGMDDTSSPTSLSDVNLGEDMEGPNSCSESVTESCSSEGGKVLRRRRKSKNALVLAMAPPADSFYKKVNSLAEAILNNQAVSPDFGPPHSFAFSASEDVSPPTHSAASESSGVAGSLSSSDVESPQGTGGSSSGTLSRGSGEQLGSGKFLLGRDTKGLSWEESIVVERRVAHARGGVLSPRLSGEIKGEVRKSNLGNLNSTPRPSGLTVLLPQSEDYASKEASAEGGRGQTEGKGGELSEMDPLSLVEAGRDAEGEAGSPRLNQGMPIVSRAGSRFSGSEDADPKLYMAVVKSLVHGSYQEKQAAVAQVRQLARSSAKARRGLQMAGAVAPLVAMLDKPQVNADSSALLVVLALLNLCIGNERNKQELVVEGAVPKLINLMNTYQLLTHDQPEAVPSSTSCLRNLICGANFELEDLDKSGEVMSDLAENGHSHKQTHQVPSVIHHMMTSGLFGKGSAPAVRMSRAGEAAGAVLLTLSAATSLRKLLAAAGVVPPLVLLLIAGSPLGRVDAVRTLLNLCAVPANRKLVIDAGGPSALLTVVAASMRDVADKALAVIAMLAEEPAGVLALRQVEKGVQTIVGALKEGSDFSQEQAAAALLRMCGRCPLAKKEAIAAGAVQAALELSQAGCRDSHRTAVKLVECLRQPSLISYTTHADNCRKAGPRKLTSGKPRSGPLEKVPELLEVHSSPQIGQVNGASLGPMPASHLKPTEGWMGYSGPMVVRQKGNAIAEPIGSRSYHGIREIANQGDSCERKLSNLKTVSRSQLFRRLWSTKGKDGPMPNLSCAGFHADNSGFQCGEATEASPPLGKKKGGFQHRLLRIFRFSSFLPLPARRADGVQ